MKNKTKRLLCVVNTLFVFNNYLLKGKYFEKNKTLFYVNFIFNIINELFTN